MKTVLVVFGTRPEAIKLAPVIAALAARPGDFRTLVCSTGQHREMLDSVVELFGLTVDVRLDVMQPDQSLAGLTAKLFAALDGVIAETGPDWVVVQGDTTTAFVAAMAAYYRRVAVAHVEAGLRTYDKWRPFPEEINRRFVDLVADACYAPTEHAASTLRDEGVPAERILFTGNTVIDAVLRVAEMPFDWDASRLSRIDRQRPIVLVTAHRRESFGGGLEEICAAVAELAGRHSARGVQFVFPVHLNPNVRGPVNELLGQTPGVHLLDPLDYRALLNVLRRSRLVLTDSGGIQEEAPAFGVPVVVMRDSTERPEGVLAGVARLVGASKSRIVEAADEYLDDRVIRAPANTMLYGDGRASIRIADDLHVRTPER